MTKLLLDVMGGDYAPQAQLKGALLAWPELKAKGTKLVLVGDQKIIQAHLKKRVYRTFASDPDISILHSAETIGMEDSIKSIRSKPQATINLGCKIAGDAYEEMQKSPGSESALPTGFISAGHSGAMMASAVLYMGRIKGIDRPAIGVKLPTLKPEGCVVLDVGANVDCKPEHLKDFALMGACFSLAERKGQELPRVGLLSNGEERSKGTELTRAAYELIEKHTAFQKNENQVGEFVGYVEGKEIFKGSVDVVVADGFVGNVVLKSLEGLGSTVVSMLKNEAKKSPFAVLGFFLASGVLLKLKRKLDYAEYGAAPLFGVSGYAFICHGRSNPKAMKNALLRAHSTIQSRMIEKLVKAVAT